jgi:hypothetical protein
MLNQIYLVSAADAGVVLVMAAVFLLHHYDSNKVNYHVFFYVFEKDLEDPFQIISIFKNYNIFQSNIYREKKNI